MKRSKNNRRAFYVIQFIELPFEGIDDYVCVPYTWLKVRRPSDHKAAVAYPKDENPFDTRDRVKRKGRYDDEWRFYMAAVKYESDTYKDAEYWIATRNDYGPLVEKELTISDTPSRFRLNNKLRNANQSNSSQFNDNPGKPLPRISIKQPALSELEKQPDGKRLKLDEVAQSSSAVVNDASTDPGRSKRGQSIIIQDIQSMECAQTEETAAATNGNESTTPRTQTQHTEQNKQALSVPIIDVDEPKEVMNIDEKDHSRDGKLPDENSIISQRHLSNNPAAALIIAAEPSTLAEQTTQPNQHDNQEQMLDSGSSLSNFQPRIENVRSIATNYKDHERHVNDESNNELTSHYLPDSLKMSAHFYNHINGARRLVPIQEPVEKRIRLMNITKNLALASQNPLNLMDQTGSPSTHSVAEQSSVVTQSRSQDSPREQKMDTENRREQTAPIKSMSICSQAIQHAPKINVDQRLDGHHSLVAQEQNFKRTRQNQYLPINQNSFKQDLLRESKENNNYDHQSNSRTIRTTIPSTKLNATHLSNPMYQTSEHPQQRQPQPNQHDLQRQQQRPKMRVGIPITPKNNRRIPTPQGVTKKILEQQMLDNFSTLFTQMGSTLRYTCDMYNNLRSSILETAETYRSLLDAVERFNEVGNSTSNAFTLSNVTPGVPQAAEERHVEVTARANSSHENQHSNNVADKAPKKIHNNLRRFVLPLEYDPNDTRWTLKYRTNLPGLVELMPQSGIYVSYGELKYCERVSNNCKSLARRLLPEVFNKKALGVCLSMSEKAQASNNVGSNLRPELDEHASKVLLNFVLDYGLQCGWNTDLKPILSTLHNKIQERRFKC